MNRALPEFTIIRVNGTTTQGYSLDAVKEHPKYHAWGTGAPPPAHSPQLHYEDKLHEVDHFQEIIGFKQPHGFQNLGEAQQHDVASQPAEGERPVRTCHAAAGARPRRRSKGRRPARPREAAGRCPLPP